MRIIFHNAEDAKILLSEIESDTSDWFHPKGKPTGGPGPGDFDYGRMRFVNRNLNYFYFDSVISMALKNDYEYNPNYPKMLEFCNNMRTVLNEQGPFGRMCIWRMIPHGYLLPHKDNWEYHNQIRRYIFCISEHSGAQATIKINNTVIEVEQGLFFQFDPATDLHEFVNHTDKDWYFLGFDFWDIDKLQKSAIERDITKETIIEYNPDLQFGGKKSYAKFMSKE
jgi:hypothetical protein